MSTLAHEAKDPICARADYTILDLTVRNHPGVMSHICGLFSRRAYNVEGIVCTPLGRGEMSRIRLFVNENERLDQVVKQVGKLRDVLEISRHQADPRALTRLEEILHRMGDG